MEHHLAHIVALLGPPPAEFVKDNDMALQHFNEDGKRLRSLITFHQHFSDKIDPQDLGKELWKFPKPAWKTQSITLEDSEHNLKGANKAFFLAFVRKMLRWKPEERSIARELLKDV